MTSLGCGSAALWLLDVVFWLQPLPAFYMVSLMYRKLRFLRLVGSGAAIGLLCSICVVGQSPGGQGIDKYKVEGTVVNSVTGEPIPRVLVQLFPNHQAALTGPDGSFHFEAVPPPHTIIRVRKPGFYNDATRRGWHRDIFPELTVGPHLGPVTLKLIPEAVIFGRVEDVDGEPIEGAAVRVIQLFVTDGRQQRNESVNFSAEDGSFRMAEMLPGRYYIAVQPNQSFLGTLAGKAEDVKEGYPALVYYPNGTDITSAMPVDLAPGQRMQINFSLKPEPQYTISGVVPTSSRLEQLTVEMVGRSGERLNFWYGFSARDKTFTISKVPAGKYVIQIYAKDENGDPLFAEMPLTVTANKSGLRVPLQPESSIPVNVSIDFAGPGVAHGRVDYSGSQTATVYLHADGPLHRDTGAVFKRGQDPSLRIDNVAPGKYFVEIHANIGGYVQSARCGNMDLLREPLVVSTGGKLPPMEIVLRDDVGMAAGRVQFDGPPRQSTVLMAAQFAPAQPPKQEVTGVNGDFQLEDLAPGEYKVYAFDSLEQIEYTNPEALSRYDSKAARVTVPPNGKVKVSPELIVTEK